MSTIAIGSNAERSVERATGVDLTIIRLGRALEEWGMRRARRSPAREDAIARHADLRATAAALTHLGMPLR